MLENLSLVRHFGSDSSPVFRAGLARPKVSTTAIRVHTTVFVAYSTVHTKALEDGVLHRTAIKGNHEFQTILLLTGEALVGKGLKKIDLEIGSVNPFPTGDSPVTSKIVWR